MDEGMAVAPQAHGCGAKRSIGELLADAQRL